MNNRRGFLGLLGLGAAGSVLPKVPPVPIPPAPVVPPIVELKQETTSASHALRIFDANGMTVFDSAGTPRIRIQYGEQDQ